MRLKKMRLKTYVATGLLMAMGTSVFAQENPIIKKYTDKYPDKEAAAIEMRRKLDFDIVNGEPEITYSTSEELIYLSKKVYPNESRSVSSSRFVELTKLEAFVSTPDKDKYKTTEIKEFKESSLDDDNIFFDDSKQTNFQFSGLTRGSRSVIKSEYKINDPHFVPSMAVHPYLPVEKCIFEISYPTGLDLGFTELNFKEGVLIIETVKGKRTTRTYEFNDTRGAEPEGDGPDWRYFTPEVHVRLKSYQAKDKSVNVLRNVNDLHSWYCGFLSQSSEEIGQFKVLTDSIVQGCKTDREKAEKLYIWVQKNIRYIAIEDGYMGYIPQKASLVCHNRYGDCKGMSNLLCYMMRSQNLPAYHAWVGTRTLPYSYEKMASPVVDNHMVVCYKENGKNLFLDPTHPRLPFGMPSPFIQGKESMVTNNCDSYEVITVPVVKAEDNMVNDSCWVKLEGNKLVGEGKAVLTGHLRMSILDRSNPQDAKAFLEFCKVYLAKGTNKFLMDSVWTENIDDPNKPLIIRYKFSNPDYVLNIDGETFVNLNLDKQHSPEKIKKEREVAVEYKFAMRYVNTVVFSVPAGLKVKENPQDYHMETPSFTYHNTYKRIGDTIIRQTVQDRNVLSIMPSEFDAWNNFQKNYTAQSNTQTTLSKIQ